ncbi:MAG: LytR C-terminal domain-containing protein [Leifsonia flava]
MATSYPEDRFDDIPKDLERVGAHRSPRKRGRGWIALGWAALATVVLVVIGAVAIMLLNNGLDSAPGDTTAPETPAATATATPTQDPSVSITVLNGTGTSGLAREVADSLGAAGWTIGAASNADKQDYTDTVVYYADATLEGAARGLAAAVPGADVQFSQDFADAGAQLVLVVGSDYESPA